jgi:hypothetical protein
MKQQTPGPRAPPEACRDFGLSRFYRVVLRATAADLNAENIQKPIRIISTLRINKEEYNDAKEDEDETKYL